MTFGKGHHLHLIDGSGFIFRAYHALPPLTRKSDGLPVGAVSGFCNMLFKIIEDQKGSNAPTHLVVVFDAKGKTFRSPCIQENQSIQHRLKRQHGTQCDSSAHYQSMHQFAEREGVQSAYNQTYRIPPPRLQSRSCGKVWQLPQ